MTADLNPEPVSAVQTSRNVDSRAGLTGEPDTRPGTTTDERETGGGRVLGGLVSTYSMTGERDATGSITGGQG